MKRSIALLLAIATVLLCGCSSESSKSASTQATTAATEPAATEPTAYQMITDPGTPVCDGKTLKILTISSSFGLNTTNFLYEVAADQGCTDITIGRLFLAEYKKTEPGNWNTTEGYTMLQGILDEDWDIIFLQHSATGGAEPNTYSDEVNGNYIDLIMGYVRQNMTNPDARFVWNMTWAFPSDSTSSLFVGTMGSDQMKMYQVIVDTVHQHIIPRTDFATIIPTGTAIQNARSSYFGDTLNRDNMHLNELGYVIAGYITYAALTQKPIESIGVDTFGSVILLPADKDVIIESVNNALANPYEVTESEYK